MIGKLGKKIRIESIIKLAELTIPHPQWYYLDWTQRQPQTQQCTTDAEKKCSKRSPFFWSVE